MYTRIKFCGITNADDLWDAVELGVDAVGLVFHAPSSRAITVQQAREILRIRPPFITYVGLFLNDDALFVNNVIKTVALDMLQFHGDESSAFCTSFGLPYLKSVSMAKPPDLKHIEQCYKDASGFVLDSHAPGAQGGTGLTFDWAAADPRCNKAIILAGGLNPQNVASAISIASPYAVDVSSGIESSKGKKDLGKMQEFVKAVRSCDEN